MDESTVVLLGLMAVVAIVAIVAGLLLARRHAGGGEAIARLEGQLSQLGQDNAELRRNLDAGLAGMSTRIGETLHQQSERTHVSLTGLMARLAVIDQAQANIKELSGHVVGLQDVLSNKQARGAFGESQLADILQNALPRDAYGLQVTLGNGSRCDCLLRLPNPPGSIAIDAKFPLEGFRQLMAAEDDAGRVLASRAFSVAVRKHVVDIAEKYILPGETGDWALMFLPSERVYAELHANFANVVDEAQRRRVGIVSPATMMALVTTIRAVLRDVQMREHAAVIQKHVAAMANDVQRLDERAEALQKHFVQTARDVDQIRISTGKIVGRTEKIAEVDMTEPASPALASPPDQG